jgi:hypothetical protein
MILWGCFLDGKNLPKSPFSFTMLKSVSLLSVGVLLASALLAQTPTDLPSISAEKLQRPANWQLIGGASATPDQPTLTTKPGNALLLGQPGEPINLLKTGSDFSLRFEIMMPANATVQLILPAGQPIALNIPEFTRLMKASGLWQTIEINYRAATPKQAANLSRLAINGVTVREGQTLIGVSNTASSAQLSATTGVVAVRNVAGRMMNNRNIAQWSGPLSYTIFKGDMWKRDDITPKAEVLKTGTTDALNYEVAYGRGQRYTILYTGKLNLTEPGECLFALNFGGVTDLRIDGKELIAPTFKDLGNPTSGRTTLSSGLHTAEVLFTRTWPRPGLGLFVSLPDTRPQPLHTMASLPEPDPVGAIAVEPDAAPVLLRSFIQLPGEKTKRTHSLSVGTPAGVHFSYDLNQMALLQTWKGNFADMTEMWYERGEPQLLQTLGTTVLLPAQPAMAQLADEQTAWPDSLAENILKYKGLTVDKNNLPVIEYTLAGTSVTDAIRPIANGLTRTISLAGTPTGALICRVAANAQLEDLGKGLYNVGDGQYYIRLDPKLKPRLRTIGGRQELLVAVKGTVSYEVVF